MDKTVLTAKQKLNQLLLTILILSLGFGQLLRFDLTFGPIFIHDIILILLILTNLNNIKTIKIDKLFRPAFIFTSLAVLSLMKSTLQLPLDQVLPNSLYLIRFTTYLLVFFVIKNNKLTLPKKTPLFLTAGLITIIIGLTQYTLLPDVRFLKFLGWDDHLNRLTFPHYDPTFTATMIGLTSLLALKSRNLLLITLSFPALLLTYARSILSSLVISVFLWRKKLALIFLAVVVLGFLLLPKKFGEGNNLLRTFSISSRISHDRKIISLFTSNPLLGIGMNNIPSYLNFRSEFPARATTANNSYIFLLATTGILATSFFLQFLFRLYRQSAFKPSLIFILIASLFNNILFYPFALLWILLLESVRVPNEPRAP